MAIDVWACSPILSNKYGGLSGPALHPIVVALVYEAFEKTKRPIVGAGGVATWEDAVELMLAGATAIQIGSVLGEKGANFFKELCESLSLYLERKGLNLSEVVGLAHRA